MEKNRSSNPSVCRKIRQALASNPSLRAIHRSLSNNHQEPRPVTMASNSPSSFPTNTATQTKPPLSQHPKVNTEWAAKVEPEPQHVPIQGIKAERVAFPRSAGTGQGGQGTKAVASKGEDRGKPKAEAPGPLGAQHGHGLGVHSEQHGKKPLDINDTFSDYIQRAKHKLRSVSNVGRGQSNPAPDHEDHGANKKENHKDRFSDFIHLAKKKFRTTRHWKD